MADAPGGGAQVDGYAGNHIWANVDGSIGLYPAPGSGVAIGPQGTATPLLQIVTYSVALSPAAVAANTTAEQTFTVTGLASNDKIFVSKPSAQAGLFVCGERVAAANTLALTFGNVTAGAITPTAGELYTVVAIRS